MKRQEHAKSRYFLTAPCKSVGNVSSFREFLEGGVAPVSAFQYYK